MFDRTEVDEGVGSKLDATKLGALVLTDCFGTHVVRVFERGVVFEAALGPGLPVSAMLLPLPPGHGPVTAASANGPSVVRDGVLWLGPTSGSQWVRVFDLARVKS